MKARYIISITIFMGIFFAGIVTARTIAPGEIRVVKGKVTAVDVEHNALVVDTKIAKGILTVGVTIDARTTFSKGKSLEDIKVGDTVILKYTREDGRLIAKSISF